MEQMKMVVGFLFSDSEERVALLRKDHPEWQDGKLNGIGGHVREGESYGAAMLREGMEEAGVMPAWTLFVHLEGAGFTLHCYRAQSGEAYIKVPPKNDVGECFEKHWTQGVHGLITIPNLRWLVPLAHSSCQDDWPLHIREPGAL